MRVATKWKNLKIRQICKEILGMKQTHCLRTFQNMNIFDVNNNSNEHRETEQFNQNN